jgi:hypothetical protein
MNGGDCMWRSLFYSAVGLMLLAGSASAQPAPYQKGEKLAPEIAPSIYRASASEENGQVLIRVSWRAMRIAREVEGKPTRGWVHVWENVKPLALGEQIQAYDRQLKPLSKQTVLKALAKQVTVVVFVRGEGDPDKIDPLYMEVLKDDAVILVFKDEVTRQ